MRNFQEALFCIKKSEYYYVSYAEKLHNIHIFLAKVHHTLLQNCPYSEFVWSVFSGVQSQCGKILTRKTPNKDTFHSVTKKTEFHLARVLLFTDQKALFI